MSGGASAMSLELRLRPVLPRKQSGFGAQGHIPRMMADRCRGELMLIEGGRMLGRARLLMVVELESVGRRGGVVRLRRRHVVDVVGIEGRLLEERRVVVVARPARGRE